MKERILLGYMENKEAIYLTKHSWDCGWYWGMGYIGNRNCRFHIESLIKGESDVTKVFPCGTDVNQTAWWLVRDLFIQAYALKEAAEVYRFGGHQSSLKGVTDKILDEQMCTRLNKDLETVLDTVWTLLGGKQYEHTPAKVSFTK